MINNVDVSVINPITKKIKEDWITALRSGEYKQGTGRLITTDNSGSIAYCCLGVLKKITNTSTPSNKFLKTRESYSLESYELLPGETQYLLSEFNDKEGKDFNQIAEWISKNINPEE